MEPKTMSFIEDGELLESTFTENMHRYERMTAAEMAEALRLDCLAHQYPKRSRMSVGYYTASMLAIARALYLIEEKMKEEREGKRDGKGDGDRDGDGGLS